MRWSKNKSRYAGEEDLLASEEIIHEAFYEGHLRWHIYQMVLSKIRANLNGSWMFELEKQKSEKLVENRLDKKRLII